MSEKIRIGVVGLGLMGSSIATCILAAGHEVTALTRHIEKADEARKRILNFLESIAGRRNVKRRSWHSSYKGLRSLMIILCLQIMK